MGEIEIKVSSASKRHRNVCSDGARQNCRHMNPSSIFLCVALLHLNNSLFIFEIHEMRRGAVRWGATKLKN